MRRTIFDEDHDLFRTSVREFLQREVVPNVAAWDDAKLVDRSVFLAAGRAGFLAVAAPERFGGGGSDDFRFNQVLAEEIQLAGVNAHATGISLHNDVCLPYFLHAATEEQQARWLPGIASGELITAIAMTEPGAGSDLAAITTTARRDGDRYVVSGAKTFITNGINADLVVTAVKTDPAAGHRGISLLVLERGMAGFERGRKLAKIGLHAQDTAELFFDDVRVPVENRLGDEGTGFYQLMRNLPQERLNIAVHSVAAARAALEWTVAYVTERRAFGQAISSFQHTRFRLAELATEVEVGQTFVDRCVLARNRGELTAQDAAMAKLWTTELQGRAVDIGVQLHGGYGYMEEYPIARAFVDARITRIYGGSNEIMKEIVGRGLGL